jgi:hypothetical protein
MNIQNSDTSSWALDLSGFQPEYTPVKAWTLLQFYQMIGRKTTFVLDNFCPYEDLKYCVYSPKEKRYYFKTYPDVPLWLVMFYDPNGSWDSYDSFLNQLREKVDRGHVHILFTTEQIAEMSSFLIRLYKSHFNNEGKVPYKLYLQLMEESLRREDYADNHKDLTGYRTVLKIYDEKISAIWKQCYKE